MRESRTLVAARMSVTGWLFGVAQALLMGLLAVFVLASGAAAQQNQINTVVGGGPNDMPALDADLYQLWQVAVDSAGNLYFASSYDNRVFKVTVSTGELTVVAGNGVAGYSGDGVTGGAAKAMLDGPQGVAVDSNGNVYISDTENCIVRKVNQTTSTITTVAGTPDSCGYAGDGGPGTSAKVYYPDELAVDSSNNVFIADYDNALIRKLTVSTGDISTVAGSYQKTAALCPNGTVATSCGFSVTPSVAVDANDDIFLTDGEEYVVYEVSGSTGKITTIAGTGTSGYSGNGGLATSAEIDPYAYGQIAANSAGTKVWLSDTYNFVVRQIIVGGDISAVVGQNSCGGGFSGMGGAATSACIAYPGGITVDSAGDLFTAPSYVTGYSLYALEAPCLEASGSCTPPTGDTTGDIYIVAGNGSYYSATAVNGIPGLGVTLYYPAGVLVDPSNNIFVSDTDNCHVRELVNSSGDVNGFAGDGTCGYSGDGGAATSAEVSYPQGSARDANGNIFFADTNNHIIREVNTSGDISTFAGTPQSAGYGGDGGPASSAHLYYPGDVFLDVYGNMYIADTDNHIIREVVCATTGTQTCTPPTGETAGYIYTVAGTPSSSGYSGDGGPATSAKLYFPGSASTDAKGNLYIADTYNWRIREVYATTGTIDTIAGNGSGGFSGDGPATQNTVYYPQAIRADANGNVFFTDTYNQRIRWVDGGGTMTTFAGTTYGFSGDGGPASTAELGYPKALSEDASGDFYIADTYNYRIREINAFAAVGRSTGSVSFPLQSVGTTSDGSDVTLSGIGPVSISSITTSSNFSEVDDCGGSLPNGSTCTVTVYFTPTKAGTITGTLTVTTNGYFSTTTTIALEGEAVGLTITPNPLAFGSAAVGASVTKTVTVKGSTTYTSTTIDKDTTDFAISANTCTGTVATSCVITVKFSPVTPGAKKATLVIQDSDPTSPQLVAITGTATSYESFTPASVTFATTVINTSSKATKIEFKYAGTGSITLSSLTPTAPFTVNETGITTDACDPGTTVLTTNEFCYFNVVFSPTATGTTAGSVTATFSADEVGNTTAVLPLTGTGTAVSISPASLGFGTVTSGTKNLSVTVTNKGTAALTFSAPTISGTGAAQFAVLPYSASPATSTCLSGTASLSQNQSCTITVQFSSTGNGDSYTATLTINDSDPASPQKVTMTGKE